ncbi:Lar family restriction alleviation protein [Stutzerimonas nitrititolerans]|uniref:Lar family restriction alleviation protein n=1 Tax=Stutzerimonas nitrititolerans TaxID=2482751 RepID=UPI00289EEE91|nr:Lar family restriction alleviation protein [Stutzerimonas nitrititolerans]
MSEELKPCPFCGQQDAFVEQLDSDASVVICQGMVDEHSACLARGPVGVQQSDLEDQPGRDAAIAEWNRRAQPAEAEGVVDTGSDAWMALHLLDRLSVDSSDELRVMQVEGIVKSMSAALSAVTAERDRLREELERNQLWHKQTTDAGAICMRERDQLRAEVEGLRKDTALGSVVQRACRDLPEGFVIAVWLEKDAGTLELCLPDTDAVLDDFDGDTFAEKISNAIDAAMAAKEA